MIPKLKSIFIICIFSIFIYSSSANSSFFNLNNPNVASDYISNYLKGSVLINQNQYSLIENRGQWIQYKQKDYSAEVIATFHPNFLIKQPNQKKNSWKDLQILQQKIVEFNI